VRFAFADKNTDEQQQHRSEVHGEGFEIELLHMHRAHGAKQQCGREHRKHQITKIFIGLGPYQTYPNSYKPNSDQKNHRQQGRNNRTIHKELTIDNKRAT